MYYFSYNYHYTCFYIYVLDRILNKVSFSKSFLFITRTYLALIILSNEHTCQKYIVFRHRSTYAVFQLVRKPSEPINRVKSGNFCTIVLYLLIFTYLDIIMGNAGDNASLKSAKY
jgi:hypothetical protein